MIFMHRKKFLIFMAAIFVSFMLASCASAPVVKKTRVGDTETLIATQDGKPVYKLVYTWQGDKIVRGEYWEAQKKDDKEAAKRSNILSDNAMGKKFEAMLTGEKVIDTSDVVLDVIKDGFVLKSVKAVKYNSKGLPTEELQRSYKKIPVLGFFNIKVDKKYKYNENGQLIQILERNLNVDTILLQGLAIGNITLFERDGMGRPTRVLKTIGSVPPTIELTTYSYYGNSNNMRETVYEKAGIDMKKLAIVKSSKITFGYNNNIPWEGRAKYNFDMLDSKSAVSEFLIYNLVDNKNELDMRGFMKKSKLEQAMLVKNLVMVYKNESVGPKWRMGELPDVPEPFLMYKDYTWY